MRRSRIVTGFAPVIAVAVAIAIAAVILGGAGRHALAAPPKKGVDPEADKVLRQMTDYLSGLQSFSVQSFAVDETALKSGEKIQATSDSVVMVQRPDRMRSMQRGSGEGLGLWYDGKSMTVSCGATNGYETVAAPPNLDAAIDLMRKQFKVDAPGADLLYSKPYDILMEQVVSGRVIGKETVQGVPATHLAFKGEDVDFQLWIQEGNQPLPLRFVITTKTVKGSPQFSVQLSNWDTHPKFSAGDFSFNAQAGAKPVSAVSSGCMAGSH